MIYLRLFWEFFKTGLFAVGGGMATIPFLYDISDKTGWFTHTQLADMIAVGESTPGPIGVNMATYVGFTTAGIPGGIIATLGIVTPSVIIILIIARMLKQFRQNRYVDAAFYGLRPCSVALIAAAGVLVLKVSLLNIDLYAATKAIGDLFRWKCIALAAALLAAAWLVPENKKTSPNFPDPRLRRGRNFILLCRGVAVRMENISGGC